MPTQAQTARLIELIEAGQTQREIARDIGASLTTINEWIKADPELDGLAAYARTRSAESWLDRGLSALEDAPPDAAEVARAKAIDQHCRSRAAIRNPAYRDGHNVAVAAALTVTWPVAVPPLELPPAT